MSDATVERLVDRSVDIIARCGISSESVIRTVNWFWAQRAGELFGHASNKVRKLEIIGGGLAPINGLLINELRVCFDSIEFRRFDEIGLNPQYIDSVATAVLGLMHIDQMPANIPWLTGCQFPRVLGRLTPGRPSNWRQVIMEMADYRPPVMKLREAV